MMAPRRSAASGTMTATDTAAHQMAALPCRGVWLRCRAANTSSVTILGVRAGAVDSDGLVLAKTDGWLMIDWITDLQQLGFKLGTANDVLEYLTVN